MHSKYSNTLNETVQLVGNFQRLAPKKVLKRFEGSRDRAMSLFGILATSETALSDAEVMRRANMSKGEYQRALWKLKTALLNSLLEFDLAKGKYSKYSQTLHQLELANARIQILRRLGSAYTANAEAKTWMKVALKVEKWDIAHALLIPQLGWAALSGNSKTYDLLHRERTRLKILQSAYESAQEIDDRVTIVFAKSSAEHPELHPMIVDALAKLGPIIQEHGTFTLQEVALRLRKKALQVLTRFPEALTVCDELDTLLTEYPTFDNRVYRGRNMLTRLLCLVLSRQYPEATRAVPMATKDFDADTQNWYTLQEGHYMLLMRRKEYDAAYALVKEIMGRARFRVQSQSTQDRWHLFLLYAEYFTQRTVPDHNLIKLFPSFTKDYAGYRMSALLLEIVVLLSTGEKSALIERMESLQTYKLRHLRRASPSRIFIAMSRLMTKYDFEKSKIAPRAARYVQALIDSDEGDPLMECQVFAYEQIWAFFMAKLPEVGKLFPDEEGIEAVPKPKRPYIRRNSKLLGTAVGKGARKKSLRIMNINRAQVA
jgi:hypothetical protein